MREVGPFTPSEWEAWLDGTTGATRTRRLNAIVQALETKDYTAADAAAMRKNARR